MNDDGCAAGIVCFVFGVIAGAFAARWITSDFHHTNECAWRLKAALTITDTLAVVQDDGFCLKFTQSKRERIE